MNIISKLLVGASLIAGASTVSAADVFLNAADQAKIVLSKTDNGDGSFTYEMESPNPTLVEIESFNCNGYGCGGFLLLKTDGPVDFSGIFLGPHVSYSYATVTTPTIGIDLNLFGTTQLTHIHEAYTYASTDPSVENFVSAQYGNASANIREFDGTDARIQFSFAEQAMLSGATTQYQTFQLVGIGKKWIDIEIGQEYYLVNDTVSQATNKGIAYSFFHNNEWVWNVVNWNINNGHYAEFRFLTNGDSKYDDGLNLSGYNTLDFSITCDAGMTIEAFFGGEDDSSQNFLTDIACNGSEQSFSFNISGANRTDIQTALWLHVPVWKNYNLGQEHDLEMRVKDVTLKQ